MSAAATDSLVRLSSLDAATVYRALDRELFWLLSAESDPRPFPSGFDRAGWAIAPTHATETLRDGDVVDLGGRTLTVIYAPGHSPDGICLLDEHAGMLFVGDTVNWPDLRALRRFRCSRARAVRPTAGGARDGQRHDVPPLRTTSRRARPAYRDRGRNRSGRGWRRRFGRRPRCAGDTTSRGEVRPLFRHASGEMSRPIRGFGIVVCGPSERAGGSQIPEHDARPPERPASHS